MNQLKQLKNNKGTEDTLRTLAPIPLRRKVKRQKHYRGNTEELKTKLKFLKSMYVLYLLEMCVYIHIL